MDAVGDDNVGEDLEVERVVDHVQVVLGRERAADAVNLARELVVRNAERRLPDVRELRKDVRHAPVVVCSGVQEHDDALAAVNQFA